MLDVAVSWRSTGRNHAIGVYDGKRVIVQDTNKGDFEAEISDDVTGKRIRYWCGMKTREEALCVVQWLLLDAINKPAP